MYCQTIIDIDYVVVEHEPDVCGASSETAIVQSAVALANVPDFYVAFSIKTRYCKNPTLSVRYEAIDFSPNNLLESFDVFDNEGNLIRNCQGGGSCRGFQTCLDSADVLGVDRIDADTSYVIKIEPGNKFHRLCGNSLSFNVEVTLECGERTHLECIYGDGQLPIFPIFSMSSILIIIFEICSILKPNHTIIQIQPK